MGEGEREDDATGDGTGGGISDDRKVWNTSCICEASSLSLSALNNRLGSEDVPCRRNYHSCYLTLFIYLLVPSESLKNRQNEC